MSIAKLEPNIIMNGSLGEIADLFLQFSENNKDACGCELLRNLVSSDRHINFGMSDDIHTEDKVIHLRGLPNGTTRIEIAINEETERRFFMYWDKIKLWLEKKYPEFYGNPVDNPEQIELTGPDHILDPIWKEVVLNITDDWQILEMWNNGFTASEIELRLNKRPRTVTSRLSVLRGKYPEA